MKTLNELIDKYFIELDADIEILFEVRELLRDLIAVVANDHPEAKGALASFLADARKTLGEDFSHKQP